MSATQSKTAPRGLALQQAATSWLAWVKARAQGLRSRWAASDPVLLHHPDGRQSVWLADAQLEQAAARRKPKFVAVEIPDDLLLRRSLALPKMPQADIDEALRLEVRSNSPFADDDVAWGCVTRQDERGFRRAEIVIASRRHIAEFMQSRWPDLCVGAQRPEAWAVAGLPAPVVLSGYGEQQRLRHQALQQRWDVALLLLACVLALLAAITPTAQLRLRALEAADAFDAAVKRASPLVRKRDELTVLNDRLRYLDGAVADRVDPAGVMEYLTRILPDDTYLYSLDIQKAKITASGHTVDAAAILQKLSADPRLKDVRSPNAVTRLPGATKEAFTVEFTLDTKPPPISPPVAAAAAIQPASGPATAPVAAAAPKPASPSPFVIGGSTR